jgi:hypothetical protein
MVLGLKRSHWILLALIVLFLFTYFGLLTWGRVEEALETLAAQPSGAQVFHYKVDRADAIFIVFMFLMLTPIALVAIGGLIAFTGAVLAGLLETIVHTPGMPDWVFTGFVYLALVVIGFFTRWAWVPEVQGFFSLIARAVLAAYHGA